MESAERLDAYVAVSAALALMSDDQLSDLARAAAPLASGVGGATSVLDIAGTRVFVKRIPLTDQERRRENLRSTANIFRLPVGYQYGLGSTGFGAWRELAMHVLTTSWVLGGHCPSFPLMYHWRVLPESSRPPLTAAPQLRPRLHDDPPGQLAGVRPAGSAEQ